VRYVALDGVGEPNAEPERMLKLG